MPHCKAEAEKGDKGADRQAMHLSQVLPMALHQAPDGPLGGYPEVCYPDVRLEGAERLQTTLRTASALGLAALLAGGALWGASRLRGR